MRLNSIEINLVILTNILINFLFKICPESYSPESSDPGDYLCPLNLHSALLYFPKCKNGSMPSCFLTQTFMDLSLGFLWLIQSILWLIDFFFSIFCSQLSNVCSNDAIFEPGFIECLKFNKFLPTSLLRHISFSENNVSCLLMTSKNYQLAEVGS